MYVIKSSYLLIVIMFIRTWGLQATTENLILSYFRNKYLQFGYVFGCFTTKEQINVSKLLMKNNMRVAVNSIEYQNLNFIRANPSSFNHIGVVVNADCPNAEDLLTKAGYLMLFDDIHHWLVISSTDSVLTRLSNINLNINTDLHVAISNTINKNAQNWSFIDVYNQAYHKQGNFKISHVGSYNEKEGYQVKYTGNKYWTRRNMTGVHFKSQIVLRQAFKGPLETYLEYEKDRRIDPYIRFHGKLIFYCKELFNFSLNVQPTSTWGYEVAKGKFDGMSGALQRNEIDFGCAGLYIKPERIPIIDYATGLWEFRVKILFRQPIIRSFSEVFLHPMSSSVWLTTLVAALLIVITLKISQKFELFTLKPLREQVDDTWSTVILSTLGAFCQQGSSQTPASLCGRIITISILMFCLLFYQFYSGSIVSSLLIKPPATIRSPSDLLKSPLKFGADSVLYMQDYFKTTKNPTAIAIYKEKMLGHGNSSNFYPPEYGLKLVDAGGFAYQVEEITGNIFIHDFFSDKAICELGEVEMFTRKTLMTALPKNSPFRDMLNYGIRRLAEHGIGAYQKAHWGARKPECFQSSHSISFHVGIKEIYPAIVLLHIGILVSLIILGVEIVMKRKDK